MAGPGTNVDGKIDLHSHSRASDGEYGAADVALRARAAGLSVWALCDHDTVAGLGDAAEAAGRLGLRLVPGIELSAFLDQKEIHVLGHFVDPGHASLRRFEDTLAEHRRTRMAEIVRRLAALNVHVSADDIEGFSGGKTIGRPHVARAILEKGYVATVKEAFDRFLAEGMPAYVPRFRLEVADAVALVREAGGTATIAHPGVSRLARREVERARAAGVVGLEVHHVDHDPGTRERLLRLAEELGMVPTAGSDFHGETISPGRHLGDVTMPEEDLARLEASRP
ncbi:MAG TPA: PHP domain-containing protein [Anaeromyxobacter sp.]|nr:PHP domain-containing protein [Anaeromyxobacter sp.]